MELAQALQEHTDRHNAAVEDAMARIDRHSLLDQRAECERETAVQKDLLRKYRKAIADGNREVAVKVAEKLPTMMTDGGVPVSPRDRVTKDLALFPQYETYLERARERYEASRTVRALGRLLSEFKEQVDRLIGEGATLDRKLLHLGLEPFTPLGFNVAADVGEIRKQDREALEREREHLIERFPWLAPVEIPTAEDDGRLRRNKKE